MFIVLFVTMGHKLRKMTLHELARQSRRAQHLTQQELASALGCSQSAISYFELGNAGVLSDELLEKLCRTLGIERPSEDPGIPEEAAREVAETLAFCPNADCPKAWFDDVDVEPNGDQAGQNYTVRPANFLIVAGPRPVHCPACRSKLEIGCRNCLTALLRGAAFCPGCGEPLVAIPRNKQPPDTVQFVRRMQARNSAYRGFEIEVESLPVPRWANRGQSGQKHSKSKPQE